MPIFFKIYTVKESKQSVINTMETLALPHSTWLNHNFNCGQESLILSCSEPSTAHIDGSSIESNTKRYFQEQSFKLFYPVNNLCNLLMLFLALHLSLKLIKKKSK